MPGGENHLAEIAALAGDHATAAGYLRRYCEMLERHGNRAWLSTYAPTLGRSLCALGRYDEAEPLAQLGRELGDEQDFATQMLWRQVQARVHAHRGEHAEAERLAREAVAIAERTDALNFQGDALCDLAEVLAAAGRTRRGRRSARAGARALRAQEEPRHGCPGTSAPGPDSRVTPRPGPTTITAPTGVLVQPGHSRACARARDRERRAFTTRAKESYEETVRRITGGKGLTSAADWPVEGLLMHVAGDAPGGFRVIDVWQLGGSQQEPYSG